MNASLRQSPDLSLLVNYGEPVETAKTEPAKNKELTWRELGDCMGYVRFACSLGLKEYAARLGRKYQQVSDMIEGKERPQIELLWTDDQFRRHLIIAMARKSNGVDVVTTISVRRES